MRKLLLAIAASSLVALSVAATTAPEPTATEAPTATATSAPTPTMVAAPAPAKSEAAAPGAPPSAPSALKVEAMAIPDATKAYYDIQGRTAEDLRQQMMLYGPLDNAGTRWDALTNWSLSWKWTRGTDGSGACRVADPIVSINSKVSFPRWLAPDNAAPDLVTRWMAYTQALARHEGGHVSIAVDEVPYVEGLMRDSSCDDVGQAIQTGVQHIRDLEDKYETATDHGRTQGALFP
jgi:predicted secreted Zn-dependent protease